MKFHVLPDSVREVPSPDSFTYPFSYEPHPLSIAAASEVRSYVESQSQWSEELSQGKMLGVLVVEKKGERGFLAAFSGTLGGKTLQEYFVPPVFDLMCPGCYFQEEQERISELNRRINGLEVQMQPSPLHLVAEQEIEEARKKMTEAKLRRHQLRITLSAEELEEKEPEMIRESQFLKAQLKRIESSWKKRLEEADHPLLVLQAEVKRLQAERQQRSQDLQQWLFSQYVFLNARGERKTLAEIFPSGQIPSGAGDCCAPKLLQAAYLEGMRPLCMAEFWMGSSPKDEVRLEGNYYPACRSKCRPILGHMLQGLSVDPNPLLQGHQELESRLEILWQDCQIAVVAKPSGMLSVPGLDDLPSVFSSMKSRFPDAEGPLIVHRLDMDTSGVMVVALTPEAYGSLQRQFLRHEIKKKYLAWLECPMVSGQEGDISLPLRPDLADRPRQLVDQEHGKSAITHYLVLENRKGHALVALWPQTGRTHQLRVHCAHPLGLNNPIVGDRLYGKPAERLMLHAQEVEFTHPTDGKAMKFVLPIEF